MRRGPGMGGLQKMDMIQKRAAEVGEERSEQYKQALQQQLVIFKEKLEQFATKHKHQINKDPEFRMRFNEMCSKIGVDPLNSKKGFWATLGVGDFYYELAIQIVQVCFAARSTNGGLMEMQEVYQGLIKLRGKNAQKISLDDVDRAVKSLYKLGNGFNIIALGNRKIIQSVPLELNQDHTIVLQLAQELGCVTKTQIMNQCHWDSERTISVLGFLVQEGVVWVDDQAATEREYWFPNFSLGTKNVTSP